MNDRAAKRRSLILFVVATAVSVGATWWARLRFWYPHDEGTLGQAALRILGGEVPHQDFSYPYTGLDTLLHGLWVLLWGPSLESIRTGFAVVTTGWLVMVVVWFWRRNHSSAGVLLILLLGAFGPAAYPAAMPSWYVTMLVTGAAMVLSTNGRQPSEKRFLIAGLFLGFALSFKVTALYAIGGVGIWTIARAEHWGITEARIWAWCLLLGAAGAIVLLIAPLLDGRVWIHIGLPPLAVVGWGAACEWGLMKRGGLRVGVSSLRPLLYLTGGVIAGVTPILIWLGVQGGLPEFLHSIIAVGAARNNFATFPPPPIQALLWSLPVVGLIVASYSPVAKPRPALIILLCGLVFVASWYPLGVHRLVWQGIRGTLPLGMALLTLWTMYKPGILAIPPAIPIVGWMALSQFPFAAPVYFVYLMPLMVIVASTLPLPSLPGQRILLILGATLAAFGLLQVIPSPPSALGFARVTSAPLQPLPGQHGGLLVPAPSAAGYQVVVTILADSVPEGPIWVGPDTPEVAFLSGRRDLNRAPFGFLAGATGPDSTDISRAVAVVIRMEPAFSHPLTAAELLHVRLGFQRIVEIPPFVIMWKKAPCVNC